MIDEAMRNWMRDVASLIQGGDEWTCLHNHSVEHATKEVTVVLGGPHERIPDYPPIPAHLARTFKMQVWNWQPLLGLRVGEKKYCPADDIVSECVETQGVWEGYGTNLALDILDRQGGAFIDCGSQIGWYTMLALTSGAEVLSIDADRDTLRTLTATVESNDFQCVTARAGLNESTPTVTQLPPSRVALMKVDIEGAEDDAVRVFGELFSYRLVDFVLMEISPCFDDYYPELCAKMHDEYGFDVYEVPTKGTDLAGFGSNPLESLRPFKIDRAKLERWVADCVQRDVLFVLGGLDQYVS